MSNFSYIQALKIIRLKKIGSIDETSSKRKNIWNLLYLDGNEKKKKNPIRFALSNRQENQRNKRAVRWRELVSL